MAVVCGFETTCQRPPAHGNQHSDEGPPDGDRCGARIVCQRLPGHFKTKHETKHARLSTRMFHGGWRVIR